MSWVEQLGDGRLLIADAAGAVLLLDAATGRPCWEKAAELTPGVRLARPIAVRPQDSRPRDVGPEGVNAEDQFPAATEPASAAPIYLFDGFSISAVNPADGALLWRMGEWPSLGQRRRVDPEVLPRILAAHATPEGVLALRDDGAMGLLSTADGSLRWRREIGAASQARLFVADGAAWLLWRGVGGAWATRFAPDQPPEELSRRLELGEVLPTWSRSTADGRLVLVWTDRLAVLSPALERRDIADVPAAAIQQRSVELAGTSKAPLLVLADVARGVRAVDLNSGTLHWQSARQDTPPATPWTALAVDGARVAAVGPDATVVYALWSGEREYAGQGADVVRGGLFIRGDALYAVELPQPPASQATVAPERHACLLLRSACLDGPSHVERCMTVSLAVDPAGLRRVMLVGDHLLVETAARLAAFRLPACEAVQDREKPASRPAEASGSDGAGR